MLKTYSDLPNFTEVSHPLVQHKLSLLRDEKTSTKDFKQLLNEITMFIVYEATKDLPTTTKFVKTPLGHCEVPVLSGRKPVILPILRAGIGMVDGFLALIPSARIGHIGLFRDEKTLEPKLYYFKIPKSSEERTFFICDPMLATGGSASITIQCLKDKGIKKIIFMSIVSAPEGVHRLLRDHPDVPVFSASLDEKLDEKGYILPGLGDAGDRLFGTK